MTFRPRGPKTSAQLTSKSRKATTAFLGLELDAGAKLEAPSPRLKLRMEVYGDSISVGLGCDRKRVKEEDVTI